MVCITDKPRKLATIARHLAASKKKHQLLALPSAVRAPALDVVLKGIARELGKRQKQAPAFTVAHLKNVLKGLDYNPRPASGTGHCCSGLLARSGAQSGWPSTWSTSN